MKLSLNREYHEASYAVRVWVEIVFSGKEKDDSFGTFSFGKNLLADSRHPYYFRTDPQALAVSIEYFFDELHKYLK